MLSCHPPLVALIAVLLGGQFAQAWPDSSLSRPSNSLAPTAVQVSVLDSRGRHWNGRLDQRTDHRHLWLKKETSAVCVVRALAWTDVVQIQYHEPPPPASPSRTLPRRVGGRSLADEARDALGGPPAP